MHEEPDRGGGRNFARSAKEAREKHEMIVVHPDDVAFLMGGDDGVREALVDGDVLLEGCALVEHFRLWGVWDGIVETRPQDLVAKLGITARELSVRNPDGYARMLWESSK